MGATKADEGLVGFRMRYRVGKWVRHDVSSSVVHLDSCRANGVSEIVNRGVANWMGWHMNKWLDQCMWCCMDNRMCRKVMSHCVC